MERGKSTSQKGQVKEVPGKGFEKGKGPFPKKKGFGETGSQKRRKGGFKDILKEV